MSGAHPSTTTSRSSIGLADYIPALKAYIARNIRNQSLVDDMVQEVMLRMQVRQAGAIIENMEGYLFRVASSVLTDNARRENVRLAWAHGELSETDHPVEELSPERVIQARQQVAIVREALMELPTRTRDIFLLRRFEGLSYAEIASRFGISVSAVEKHVAKAMQHVLRRTRG